MKWNSTPDIFVRAVLQYPKRRRQRGRLSRLRGKSPCSQLQSGRCRRHSEPRPAHLRENGELTSSSEPHNGSVHRCSTVGRRQPTLPPATSTSAICRDASSAGRKTNTASCATAWRCKPANTHIKREKATSNICTAQALLATMAGFYAVYHGPEGIRTIAERIHSIAVFLEKSINRTGIQAGQCTIFRHAPLCTARHHFGTADTYHRLEQGT